MFDEGLGSTNIQIALTSFPIQLCSFEKKTLNLRPRRRSGREFILLGNSMHRFSKDCSLFIRY